ncbi:amino acid ABC transporter permease [Desulfuribacillus alkaliarsenatis]|uniref:ABC transporter permease n=1 Tax=Desulfuribacillus alkaliarsenatis TaxID=766136 RepID=A0A1E5G171_9FIRM|nr:ABC transporter permease [Desulfuribacillus alkaliarsenatis]
MNVQVPWDFTVVPEFLPLFRMAAIATLQITTFGILFGLVLGLIVGLMRTSKIWFLDWPARFYIFIIRGTPLLLQIFIIYYGLASVVDIPSYPAAIIALGVHNAAYIAEIFRGSITSVDRGQREAALSLGMTSWQSMKRIILPQAVKRSVPPLGNQFIIALKDSSLASTIAVAELLLRARQLASSNFMMMEMLVVAAVYYLIMTSVFTYIVGKVEHRMSISDHRQ